MTVTIIGGGVAGTTLALALAHFSCGTIKIDLVEAQAPESRDHLGFDARAIALAQGTCRELTAIGVWPVLSPYATPINRVEVSDKGHVGKVQIAAEDYCLSALGYVVKLHDTSKRLFDLVRKSPCVRLHCPAVLAHIHRKQSGMVIILDEGEAIHAQLVVAADGSRSPLAVQCGICWREKDYQQVAVISNVSTTLPHDNNAFERFTPYGPLALLPTSCGRSSLVWCFPVERQAEITSWDEWQFCQALQQEFGYRLGRIIATDHRQYYPLRLRTAERNISHRLALVGNAAQILHPIAGQGFNLGLRDVMTLAETITHAAAEGEDVGEYTVLYRYQQRRKPDQTDIVGITDGLIHLFVNSLPPLVVSRTIGLLAMAHIRSLRDMLTRKTLGWVVR